MSVVLLLVLCGGAACFALVVVLALVVRSRSASSSVSREGPPASAPRPPAEPARSTHMVYFLQLPIDEADATRALVAQLAPDGHLPSDARVRDAALALVRAASRTTHAFAGPSAQAMPDRCRTPSRDGVIVGLRARTTVALDAVRDDSNATNVAASLQHLASLGDATILDGALCIAQPVDDPSAPALVPVAGASLPGMRPCEYCRAPMPVYETVCMACGGPSST